MSKVSKISEIKITSNKIKVLKKRNSQTTKPQCGKRQIKRVTESSGQGVDRSLSGSGIGAKTRPRRVQGK